MKKDMSVEELMADTEVLLESCKALDKQLEEMKRCEEFLTNEYRTNKRWFKTEGGRITTEDIIKTAFEFGWSSRGNFEYLYSKNKQENE